MYPSPSLELYRDISRKIMGCYMKIAYNTSWIDHITYHDTLNTRLRYLEIRFFKIQKMSHVSFILHTSTSLYNQIFYNISLQITKLKYPTIINAEFRSFFKFHKIFLNS